jgi:hypothetical protein
VANDDSALVAAEVFVKRIHVVRRCPGLVGAVRCETARRVAAKERSDDAKTGVVEDWHEVAPRMR